MNADIISRVFLVLTAFVLILALVDVAARVWAGKLDARKVAAVTITVSVIALMALAVGM